MPQFEVTVGRAETVYHHYTKVIEADDHDAAVEIAKRTERSGQWDSAWNGATSEPVPDVGSHVVLVRPVKPSMSTPEDDAREHEAFMQRADVIVQRAKALIQQAQDDKHRIKNDDWEPMSVAAAMGSVPFSR